MNKQNCIFVLNIASDSRCNYLSFGAFSFGERGISVADHTYRI